MSLDEYPVPFKGTVRTRPLLRVVDIVSKPRIWNHDASVVSLETSQYFKLRTGMTGIPPTPTLPHAGVASTLNSPVSFMYTTRKFSDIEQ